MAIKKKPDIAGTLNLEDIIQGAKASQQEQLPPGAKAAEDKVMFSTRLPADLVKKIRVFAPMVGKSKEELCREIFEDFFKDKNIPV